MGLKIFGTDPADQPKPRQSFADDVVGRFRSGYLVGRNPQSLNDWRVTTGDPDVADTLHALLGGDPPQEWEASGEDKIELFTAAPSVEIIIDGTPRKDGGVKGLRQRMVLWGRNGKMISAGDGETLDFPDEKKGQPDPDAHLSFAERKAKYNEGTGAGPQIEIYFRLAENPDLGIFKFQTGSWSLVRDLAQDGVDDELASIAGPAKATLTLEPVSFEAKNGPMAGKTVSFVKPVLSIVGPAEPAVEADAAA